MAMIHATCAFGDTSFGGEFELRVV